MRHPEATFSIAICACLVGVAGLFDAHFRGLRGLLGVQASFAAAGQGLQGRIQVSNTASGTPKQAQPAIKSIVPGQAPAEAGARERIGARYSCCRGG